MDCCTICTAIARHDLDARECVLQQQLKCTDEKTRSKWSVPRAFDDGAVEGGKIDGREKRESHLHAPRALRRVTRTTLASILMGLSFYATTGQKRRALVDGWWKERGRGGVLGGSLDSQYLRLGDV